MDKEEILSKFSADPVKYYKVKLFEEQGFQRKILCHMWKIFLDYG